jgi:hypothetical protein
LTRRRDDAASAEGSTVLEISPELVLVDPELAAVARLRLAEEAAAREAAATRPASRPSPPVVLDLATPRPPAPAPVRARTIARETAARLTPTLLLVSLLLNLVFAASLFAGNSEAPTLETAPATVTVRSKGTPSRATRPRAAPKPRPTSRTSTVVAPPSSGPTKGDAERAVLQMAQRYGATKAAKLVDPATGLLRNNVQAVCRPSTGRSFLCVVRPAHHRRGEGLYVRYRPAAPGRPAKIVWLGYRLSG